METETKSKVPAVIKTFAILDLVAKEPGLTFAAIRARLGLPKSSCYHLLTTLCQLGALHLRHDHGYALGLRLFELGMSANNQRDIGPYALYHLRELAKKVQLTCHLGVLEGQAAIYLIKVEDMREIRVNTWVGKRVSLYSSSLGKVLLSELPEEELGAILRQLEWVTRAPNTCTDPMEFRRILAEVRAQGWAFDDEEDAVNIRCVAAPVRDMQGKIIAAISAVGTVLDIELDQVESLAKDVCRTADAISYDLGHRPAKG